MNKSTGDFIDYEEATFDPGFSFIIVSFIACLLLNVTLPCLVSLGGRYERRRNETNNKISQKASEDSVDGSRNVFQVGRVLQAIAEDAPIEKRDESTATPAPPKMEKFEPHRPAKQKENSSAAGFFALCFGVGRSGGASANVTDFLSGFADSLIVPSYNDDEIRQIKRAESIALSEITQTTNSSIARSSIFEGRQRRRLKRYPFKPPLHQQSKVPKPNGKSSNASLSIVGSVMSRLQHDDVSFNEAIDTYGQSNYQLPKEETSGEIDIIFGKNAWWRFKMILGGFDRTVGIAEWDEELVALFKLALPFSLQSFATGFFNILDVALIGHFVGATEANAFVIVTSLTWITNTFNFGFCEVLGKTIPSADDNHKLAGIYLNTSMAMYTIGIIPIAIIWFSSTRAIFLWFGFDDTTAEVAQDFAYLQVMLEWVTGMDYCFHLFLDVTGHEKYSTITMFISNIGQTLGVVVPVLAGQKGLVWVGVYRVAFSGLLVFGNGVIILFLGWIEPFAKGFLTMPLNDWEIVKKVASMACPLGAAYFLTYGEWELLAFFASTLGPAEVTAWAMLGYIWSMMKYLSDGIADASEVRCGVHLVSNQPEVARLSAYKSLFLGFTSAVLISSILFMTGEEVVHLLTPDPTLQRMIIELLPLIGLGHVVMTTGIISWALAGAQGRYRQATIVQYICNWGVTIPLSCIFSFGLQIDLQGLASAFVLGLALSGAANTYILIRSRWKRIAAIVSEETNIE